MIARGETCCATYRRALAGATSERDARLLRGLLAELGGDLVLVYTPT